MEADGVFVSPHFVTPVERVRLTGVILEESVLDETAVPMPTPVCDALASIRARTEDVLRSDCLIPRSMRYFAVQRMIISCLETGVCGSKRCCEASFRGTFRACNFVVGLGHRQ